MEGIVLSAAPFSINAMSGEIFTTAELDYEQITSYTITIKAEDNGTPRKFVSFKMWSQFNKICTQEFTISQQ